MSDENGIKAATNYMICLHDAIFEEMTEGLISAYLESSGMALVPLEATQEMIINGAGVFFSPEPKTTEDENARVADIWRRMVNAFPNPCK